MKVARMETVVSRRKVDLKIEMHTVLLVIISFLLGRVNILDRLFPFGIAFIGAYTIFKSINKGVIAAAMLGTFSACGFGSISYIIASLLIYGFFTRNKESNKYSLIATCIIVGCIFTAIRLIGMNFSETAAIYDLILILFEGILVFTMTYIFSFSFPIEEFTGIEVSHEKMVCTFITFALVLAGFSEISIMGASLKNIVCILAIVTLGYNQGIYVGGITGVILGMVAYISNVEMPFIIAIFAVGGILTGLFKELGKSGAVIGFVLGNGIISYYVNGLGTSFLNYEELLISAIIFLLSYNKVEKVIDNVFKAKSKVKKEIENRKFELASRKLAHTSDLLESIAKTFKNTMESDDVFSNSQIYTIVDDVKVNMCQSCKSFNNCWGKEKSETYYSLFTTVGVLESEVEDKEKLINSLLEKCEDVDSLTVTIKNIYKRYKEREEVINKINEQKLVLVEQLEGLGKLVNDINIEVYKNATFNEELEELLEKEIKDRKIDVKEVIFAQLPEENIEIYIEFHSNNTMDKIERVTRIVSNSLGYKVAPDYNFGSIEKTNRFKLIRCNRYGALTKVSEEANSRNGISGDSYTYGEIENISYSALSDGMGTGRKANIESMIAIELLEKMMEINTDKEMAIKTINNVLRTKSKDEMFTTLDISFIDLYKGKLQVIKSGACPTFIKRGEDVKVINSMSLPIGILKDVDFNIYEESIEDGDMIIMMTDGVLECSYENEDPEKWMKKVIAGLDAQNPQTIADEILHIAKISSGNEIKDDMTVLVTKVWRNNN